MRLRWEMQCERCKQTMPFGSFGIRYHGRVWHHTCVSEHLKERQKVRGKKHAPLPHRMRAKS